MARINPDLLDILARRLRVSEKALYPRIQAIAAQRGLDRHVAALVLAGENGISIQKYSTAEEREAIRGSRSVANDLVQTTAPSSAAAPRRSVVTKRIAENSKTNRTVFVVHGRDEALRKSMFDFLRALSLHPMEWAKAVLTAKGANPHVDAILDAAMKKAGAVVVLFSPDEEARLKEQFCAQGERAGEGRLSGQPRPNVLFEAGLALGRHSEKTLIAQVGRVRPFSDIAGKHIVHLTNQVQSRIDFVNRLERICPSLDRKGADWTSAGDFTPSQTGPR